VKHWLDEQQASFDTRHGFAAVLLRMRLLLMGYKTLPHPERERSEQSKDAQHRSSFAPTNS
jgi:hypothetical protein